ncbi:MAG: hypothetical protein ABEK59_00755 [Halobacteria archaeon]
MDVHDLVEEIVGVGGLHNIYSVLDHMDERDLKTTYGPMIDLVTEIQDTDLFNSDLPALGLQSYFSKPDGVIVLAELSHTTCGTP